MQEARFSLDLFSMESVTSEKLGETVASRVSRGMADRQCCPPQSQGLLDTVRMAGAADVADCASVVLKELETLSSRAALTIQTRAEMEGRVNTHISCKPRRS